MRPTMTTPSTPGGRGNEHSNHNERRDTYPIPGTTGIANFSYEKSLDRWAETTTWSRESRIQRAYGAACVEKG